MYATNKTKADIKIVSPRDQINAIGGLFMFPTVIPCDRYISKCAGNRHKRNCTVNIAVLLKTSEHNRKSAVGCAAYQPRRQRHLLSSWNGPMSSKRAATEMCNKLIAAGERDCLVRRR